MWVIIIESVHVHHASLPEILTECTKRKSKIVIKRSAARVPWSPSRGSISWFMRTVRSRWKESPGASQHGSGCLLALAGVPCRLGALRALRPRVPGSGRSVCEVLVQRKLKGQRDGHGQRLAPGHWERAPGVLRCAIIAAQFRRISG